MGEVDKDANLDRWGKFKGKMSVVAAMAQEAGAYTRPLLCST